MKSGAQQNTHFSISKRRMEQKTEKKRKKAWNGTMQFAAFCTTPKTSHIVHPTSDRVVRHRSYTLDRLVRRRTQSMVK